MLASAVPTKFPIPFANSAGATYIRAVPQASQIPIQNGAASLSDGFPPNTFIPPSAGGVGPFGQDFNGLLKQITQWNQWQSAGGPVGFDATFSTAISGYPNGAVIASATFGSWWMSLVDNNTANPDTGGANWAGVGFVPTGAIIPFGGSVAPNGYLLCYGQAVSTTTFAALFAVIGYSYGGSGASFNTPDLRGRTVYGPDAMGGTPANRITAAGGGFSATIGASGGAQNQTLTTAQLPASPLFITNAGTFVLTPTLANVQGGTTQGGVSIGGALTQLTTLQTGNLGASNSHPILSPGQVASWIIKV